MKDKYALFLYEVQPKKNPECFYGVAAMVIFFFPLDCFILFIMEIILGGLAKLYLFPWGNDKKPELVNSLGLYWKMEFSSNGLISYEMNLVVILGAKIYLKFKYCICIEIKYNSNPVLFFFFREHKSSSFS